MLRGRVVDALTGKPLRNVAIRAYWQPRLPYTPGVDPRPPDRSARTGTDGTFEIAALAAGEYSISGSGSTPGAGYLGIAYGVRRPGGQSSHLTVAAGANLDITIRAWPAANISGGVDERDARSSRGPCAGEGQRQNGSMTNDLGVYRSRPAARPRPFVPVVGETDGQGEPPARRPTSPPRFLTRRPRGDSLSHGVPLPPPTGRPSTCSCRRTTAERSRPAPPT